MIEGYVSIKEIAEGRGVTARSVRNMCANGKIVGAEKFGRDWFVPFDAARPKDNRVTMGEYINWRKGDK